MEAAMEAAARMEAAVIVIVAAREAVLVAETADAATVTVLADSECDHAIKRIFLSVQAIVPISHACSREIARFLWGLAFS
jgi:hypothetical protein